MRGAPIAPLFAPALEPSRLLLESVERYYTAKVRRHGATPRGVDWNSLMSQRLRFVQLLRVIDWSEALSLHDVGCGYGALLEHLSDRHGDAQIRYIGSDLSSEMIRRARSRWRKPGQANFMITPVDMPLVDYSVASGIFNVKLDNCVDAWTSHVASTLSVMCDASRKGFAVNFMMPEALAARHAAAAQLYGPDPERWMAYGRDVLYCDVQLVAGYGLQEYTLLMRHAS